MSGASLPGGPGAAAPEPRPAADASAPRPAPGASNPRPAPGASNPRPAPDASNPRPVPDASNPRPVPDASNPRPVPGDGAPAPGRRLPRPLRRGALLLGLAAALAACAGGPDTARRYAALEQWYLERGRLRTETAPADAPVTAESLARNFEIVAFNTEFAPGETLEERRTEAPLTRWAGEVTWQLVGDGVRPADLAEMQGLISRVEGATGLSFVPAGEEFPKILILILGPDHRGRFDEALRGGAPLPAPLVEAWSKDDRFPCVGLILEKRRTGPEEDRRGAIILIKAETQGRLRRACLHEEFVQSLGLTNDGAEVRPSIFNDDQEFALLTRHDELLLKILYDPRLSPGMTAEEGMPIVRRIVSEMDVRGALAE